MMKAVGFFKMAVIRYITVECNNPEDQNSHDFSLLQKSRQSLGPTRHYFSEYWGLFPGGKAVGIRLPIHLHLVPRLRIRGGIPPLAHMS